MTESTKTILEKYQVRKTKAQKAAFIEYVRGIAENSDYAFRVEEGMLGARNLVIGDPDSAKVVFTAHYDTQPVLPMPNFITPKNIWIYIFYQIVLVTVVMICPMVLVGIAVGVPITLVGEALLWQQDLIFGLIEAVMYLALIGSMLLIMFGPANKATANDNTSGVTVVLDIMQALAHTDQWETGINKRLSGDNVPEGMRLSSNELRSRVAFVLFDLEEVGLVGSSSFASKHKGVKKNTLLINFDCVSDGDNILLAPRRGAKKYEDALRSGYTSRPGFEVEVLSKGVFYPSDQAGFDRGVGVCALKKSKFLGVLYMDRIHTRRDTIYREENIANLVDCSLDLIKNLE